MSAENTKTRAEREARMVGHAECCGWRPPEARCGAVHKESICTKEPKHSGRHCDAVDCVQFDGGVAP